MPGSIGTYPGRADDLSQIVASVAPAVVPIVYFGQLIAPGASALILDTIATLPAGIYRLELSLGFSGVLAAGKHIFADHRNAANLADITKLALCPAGVALSQVTERIIIAAGERFRVSMGTVAAAAGEVAHASARFYLLSQ